MDNKMRVTKLFPDKSATYAAALPNLVIADLIRNAFAYSWQFSYCLFEIVDHGQSVTVLERVDFSPEGEWLRCESFQATGDSAALLKAFYDHFLWANVGQTQRLGVMLMNGITADEDLKAGLKMEDIDALLAAIEAAKRHGFGLRFFVHPK